MAIFEMRRGAKVLIDNEPYRLLKQVQGSTWQVEAERTGRLAEYETVSLLEMLRTGVLSFSSEDGSPALPLPIQSDADDHKLRVAAAWEAASTEEREAASRRLYYVKGLVGLPTSKAQRRNAITELAAARPGERRPSLSSVTRWIANYTRGGRDVAALLSRHKRKGNRGSRFSAEVQSHLAQAIDDHYLTRERPTVQSTLDVAIHRIDLVNQGKKLRGEEALPLPTLRMLQSVLAKCDPYDVCAARYGTEYAAHKYRVVLKGVNVQAGLARAEVDHTLVNLLVVDDETFLPLGRPWLSMVIDCRHKVILGFSLSFEPPSYLSVMRCLKHAILPKTYLAARYPKLHHSWPCHGIFDSLGLDNGKDFESKGLRDFADRYGIDLDYCPVRRPWIKGTIERALGSVNRGIAHGVPGTTFESILERGDYKSAAKACITLSQLQEALHIWIVDYYHQRVHRTLQMSPESSWRQEMKNREIPLPSSAVELDQMLATPDRRVLSHKGIELDHLFYNSRECVDILAAAGGRIEVEIRKPADDMGHVYLLDPRSGRLIRLPVIERFADYAAGLTPWQHKQCVLYSTSRYGGRNDAAALAHAKAAIKALFARALSNAKGRTRKAAARFLKAERPALPARNIELNHPQALLDAKPGLAEEIPIDEPFELEVTFSARAAA